MNDDPYDGFPRGFFARDDPSPDTDFYRPTRLVTHIDDRAIAAIGELYAELGIDGSARTPRRVLDLMSSWVSHFRTPPAELVVLGMNAVELNANDAASERVVRDLTPTRRSHSRQRRSTPSLAACPLTTSSDRSRCCAT